MDSNFDIQGYMTRGVERVVADAIRATVKNPRESAYMLKFASASKKASKKRAAAENAGEHIPPFLIASITSSCNLHCAGCYSRCNEATTDHKPVDQLSGEDWKRVFDEAEELGVSFILLAGGEPLLRWDVMQEASKKQGILFPVFTNGTFIGDKYLELFDAHRNLIPVISIEGNREKRDRLLSEVNRIRTERQDMVFVSFPGDEKSSGGCIAAGRGFFHINSHGDAEPCPFSPFSDVNVRNTSLKDAMHSRFFGLLKDNDILADDHKGGCVLFEKRELVKELLA